MHWWAVPESVSMPALVKGLKHWLVQAVGSDLNSYVRICALASGDTGWAQDSLG